MFSEQERATLQHIKDWGFTDRVSSCTRKRRREVYLVGLSCGRVSTRNMGLRIDHVWVTTQSLVAQPSRLDRHGPRTWEKPSDSRAAISKL
jgi:exonuclease III